MGAMYRRAGWEGSWGLDHGNGGREASGMMYGLASVGCLGYQEHVRFIPDDGCDSFSHEGRPLFGVQSLTSGRPRCFSELIGLNSKEAT